MTLPLDPIKKEAYLKKLSEAKKGKPSSFKGKHHPESAKQKLRECNLGKKQSPETIEKRVSKMRGKNHWNYGKHWDEETKVKMSVAKIGKYDGEKNPFYGKHHDEETRKRAGEAISLAFKLHPEVRERLDKAHSGENSPMWKGGIWKKPYCKKWRPSFKERVRIFFGYCCVECGTHQDQLPRSLDVHHVHYRKSSCCSDAPRDFVALCKSCHGKTNEYREYWTEHFVQIINQYYGGRSYFTEKEMEELVRTN